MNQLRYITIFSFVLSLLAWGCGDDEITPQIEGLLHEGNEDVTITAATPYIPVAFRASATDLEKITVEVSPMGSSEVVASANLNNIINDNLNRVSLRVPFPNSTVAPSGMYTIHYRLFSKSGSQTASYDINVINTLGLPASTDGFSPIYMVGDASAGGWDNTKATPMFLIEGQNGVFTHTGLFNAGGFKFLKKQGQWAPMWGVDGNGVLVPRPTEADPDPATITVAAQGYYTVTVDTTALTYSFEPFDASSATTYASIGIIGAFTNWESDVLMTQSTFDPHIWMLEYEFTADTEMKFRKAGDWGMNWGPATDEERDDLWGKGVKDGKNINILAGTYTIYFNDLTGRYMLVEAE
ncbi:SusF/SusE family outer membrane protein [Cesiribacter andamanensis]|uniref:Outer membrane protein SusF/SusE-like C-terminal domain-containing protein n=1 Tax=Cesiribacter andamanensis AMV16 TaxID=1279009 RepID=M7N4G6_9BACT|nr:SusF/SusE family outer membrane protein [Cesiribacter andamanensis]EMR02187.1 hypothetical protein ADICEAN_02662 [Cesiribacter andamanensis AMV16]